MSNVFRSIKSFLSKKPGAIKTKDMTKVWGEYETNFKNLADHVKDHIEDLEGNIDKAEMIKSSCTKLEKLKTKESAIDRSINSISSTISKEDKETINKSYDNTQGTLHYIKATMGIMEDAKRVVSEWSVSLKRFSNEINNYLLVAKELTDNSEDKGKKSTGENNDLLHKLFVLKNYQKLIVSLQNSYKTLKKCQLDKKSAACSLILQISPENNNLTVFKMLDADNKEIGFENKVAESQKNNIDINLLQRYQSSLEKLEKAIANRKIIKNNVDDTQEALNQYIDAFVTNTETIYGDKNRNFWLEDDTIEKFFEGVIKSVSNKKNSSND